MPPRRPQLTRNQQQQEWFEKIAKYGTQLRIALTLTTSLKETYLSKKEEPAKASWGASFFASNTASIPAERALQIAFIENIGNLLSEKIPKQPEKADDCTERQKDKLYKQKETFLNILAGAYLMVEQQIYKSYQNAYFSKDPNASVLYKALIEQQKELTNTLNFNEPQVKAFDKERCLNELKTFLEAPENQEALTKENPKHQQQVKEMIEKIPALVEQLKIAGEAAATAVILKAS